MSQIVAEFFLVQNSRVHYYFLEGKFFFFLILLTWILLYDRRGRVCCRFTRKSSLSLSIWFSVIFCKLIETCAEKVLVNLSRVDVWEFHHSCSWWLCIFFIFWCLLLDFKLYVLDNFFISFFFLLKLRSTSKSTWEHLRHLLIICCHPISRSSVSFFYHLFLHFDHFASFCHLFRHFLY